MHSGRRTASRPQWTPAPAAGTVHPPGGFCCQSLHVDSTSAQSASAGASARLSPTTSHCFRGAADGQEVFKHKQPSLGLEVFIRITDHKIRREHSSPTTPNSTVQRGRNRPEESRGGSAQPVLASEGGLGTHPRKRHPMYPPGQGCGRLARRPHALGPLLGGGAHLQAQHVWTDVRNIPPAAG